MTFLTNKYKVRKMHETRQSRNSLMKVIDKFKRGIFDVLSSKRGSSFDFTTPLLQSSLELCCFSILLFCVSYSESFNELSRVKWFVWVLWSSKLARNYFSLSRYLLDSRLIARTALLPHIGT